MSHNLTEHYAEQQQQPIAEGPRTMAALHMAMMRLEEPGVMPYAFDFDHVYNHITLYWNGGRSLRIHLFREGYALAARHHETASRLDLQVMERARSMVVTLLEMLYDAGHENWRKPEWRRYAEQLRVIGHPHWDAIKVQSGSLG